jgi:nicotinate-nucleotide pyrophosphorylase (carboxylating)
MKNMNLQQHIVKDIELALKEDVGSGDISALLIDENKLLRTQLLVREEAILCGTAWFEQAFKQCDEGIHLDWQAQDGDRVNAESVVCRISGPARAILTAERTALNFLQTLSGTATTTRYYVDKISQTKCRILDTRKTIPHLRLAQKYAVTCGGGLNLRIGLFDAYLIKENHLAACGSIRQAVERGRALHSDKLLEVEVETLEQLQQAIEANVDRALIDNFSLEEMKQAVKMTSNQIQLEASGNITDESLFNIANTGVDFISIGALTKHVRAIDFSLRFL